MGSDAPERIWANGLGVYGEYGGFGGTEYVRADLCAAQPAEAGRVRVKPWRVVREDPCGCKFGETLDCTSGVITCHTCGKVLGHMERNDAALTPATAAQEPFESSLLNAVEHAEVKARLGEDSTVRLTLGLAKRLMEDATPPDAPTDTALVEVLTRCLRVFEHHGVGGHLTGEIKQILAALASREAPPDAPVKGAVMVEEAAQVLMDDPDAIRLIGSVAEDIYGAGASFPHSVGQGLRALAVGRDE